MNKFFGQPIIYDRNNKPISAKTNGQLELIKAIDKYDILFVNGPAGTGKTFLAICKAMVGIKDGTYDKMIVTRPAIESGEHLGFLPGSLDEKIRPFMKPIYDCIQDLQPEEFSSNGNGNGKKKKANGGKKDKTDWTKKIEVFPLAYMRGSTIKDSFVIADEAQNMKSSQMKMFLTRIGMGSKVILTGDASQTDLDSRMESGFRHAQKILTGIKEIGFVTLTEEDIVRHGVIKKIIVRYERDAFKSGKYRGNVISNRDPV